MCVHRPFFICAAVALISQLWSVEPVERGILVPLWLCCLTPYVTLARTYYFADLTPWNAKRHSISTCIIIYSSPTVPRPRHIAFSHLDLSVSQKNRTPPFFRNYDVRYESVTSHLACKVLTPHTYLSFLRAYYLIYRIPSELPAVAHVHGDWARHTKRADQT